MPKIYLDLESNRAKINCFGSRRIKIKYISDQMLLSNKHGINTYNWI